MEEGEESQMDLQTVFKPLSDKHSQEETENDMKSPNKKYVDGKVLPKILRDRFLQQAKPGTALEDIDPYYQDKQTFVVIGKWGRIHRYSDTANNFLCATLGPKAPLRKLAVYMETHWLFPALIAATLVINLVALTIRESIQDWPVYEAMSIVDYICLSVYGFEIGVKIVARGFRGQFSSIRDVWFWFDAFIIFTGANWYLYVYGPPNHVTPWVRLLKFIPLVPRIRESFMLSLKAARRLCMMLIPVVLIVWFFSLVATQLYMGTLSQKCLQTKNRTVSRKDYQRQWYYREPDDDYDEYYDWYILPGGNFTLCGNASGASTCPKDYVCLQDDSNYYWSGYNRPRYIDSVEDAIVSVVRIASQDFTDGIYRQLISANGSWHLLFFVAIFALIIFPIGCLFYAILGNLFLEEQISDDLEKDVKTDHIIELDGVARKCDQEREQGFFAKVKSRLNPAWISSLVICVMLVDIFGILYHYDEGPESIFMYYFFKYAIPGMVLVVYGTELLVADGWNTLDIIILLTLIPQAIQLKVAGAFATLRLLKMMKFWPRLKMIFAVYRKTLRALWGWVCLSVIVLASTMMIAWSGAYQYGSKVSWKLTNVWNFFRVTVRILAGEWYQTLITNGLDWWLFYTWTNLCGVLLMGYLLVGVVHFSIGELRESNDAYISRRKGLRHSLNKLFVGTFQKLFKMEFFDRLPTAADNNAFVAADGDDEIGNATDGKVNPSHSTGKSKMQSFTDNTVYKLACVGMVGIASIALAVESNRNSNGYLQLGVFVVEVVFAFWFLLVIIFELTAHGVKLAICSRPALLFDALIVLETVLNLAIYQLSLVNGDYRLGIFWLRSFRPLMLISRVDHLKAGLSGIKAQLSTALETILAIFFIWLVFDTFTVYMLAVPFLAKNHSWVNSNLTFDNPATGFISTALLAAGTGWVSIINDATDAAGQDMARKSDHSKVWFIYFAVFILIGGLGALGVLCSHIFHKLQKDSGCTIFLTEWQAKKYTEAKSRKKSLEQSYWLSLENETIPCPENSRRRQQVYKFVTNRYFDGVIMLIIIADLIILSTDDIYNHRYYSDNTLLYCWNFIVIVYLAEMIIKLIAWGKFYFRSGWNLLDMVIVLPGVCGLMFMNYIGKYAVVFRLLRILRLARILRFLLAKEWELHTEKKFVSAFSNAKYALANLFALQALFMVTFAILGTYLFDNVQDGVGVLGDQINFKTFGASLRTLTLLVVGGLPALDGLLLGLGNETNCDFEEGTCGNKAAAVAYIGMYAGLTFYLLLNMYAVMITEIILELGRGKNSAAIEKIEMEEVIDNENGSAITHLDNDD